MERVPNTGSNNKKIGGFARNTLIIALTAIPLNIAMNAYMPFLSPYLLQIGVSYVLLGVIFTIINLSRAAPLLPGGHLADKYGRKTLIVSGGIVFATSIMLVYLTQNWISATIFLLIGNLGIQIYQPGTSAMVAEDAPQEERARLFGKFQLFLFAGGIVGTITGGYLAQIGDYALLFLLAAVLLYVTAICRLVFLKESRNPSILSLEEKTNKDGEQLGLLQKLRFVWNTGISTRAYILSLAVLFLGIGNLNPFFTPFLLEIVGLTPFEVGINYTINSIAMALGFIPGGKLADKYGRKHLITILYAVFSVTTILYPFASSALFVYIITSIQGLSLGISYPAFQSFEAEQSPAEYRGATLGVFATIRELSNAVGPSIAAVYLFLIPFLQGYFGLFLIQALTSALGTAIFAYYCAETLVSKRTN